jgi:hypothetical protein
LTDANIRLFSISSLKFFRRRKYDSRQICLVSTKFSPPVAILTLFLAACTKDVSKLRVSPAGEAEYCQKWEGRYKASRILSCTGSPGSFNIVDTLTVARCDVNTLSFSNFYMGTGCGNIQKYVHLTRVSPLGDASYAGHTTLRFSNDTLYYQEYSSRVSYKFSERFVAVKI